MTPDEARRHEWLAGPAATYPELPERRSHQPTSFFSTLMSDTSSCCKI